MSSLLLTASRNCFRFHFFWILLVIKSLSLIVLITVSCRRQFALRIRNLSLSRAVVQLGYHALSLGRQFAEGIARVVFGLLGKQIVV